MRKFEYTQLVGSNYSLNEFNELGQEGWELVSFVVAFQGHGSIAIFKREVVEIINKTHFT